MVAPSDPVTISVPRDLADQVPALAAPLLDRMHALLEQNTDGALSALERAELEHLVLMAEFSQVVAAALAPAANRP